jgi:hypothetical protein
MWGRGRARVPFARGTLDFVEVSILRFGDMGTGNESVRKELYKRWRGGGRV